MTGKVEIEVSEVRSDRVLRLHGYWSSRRGEDIPSWSEIDPSEFVYALPLVIVTAIEWAPFRVFYRLVGTQATAFRGKLTGRYLDEIGHFSKAAKDQLEREYRRTAEERRATFWRDDIVDRQGRVHAFYAGIFPLAPRGGQVDRCLAIEDYGTCDPDEVDGPDAGIAGGPVWRSGS